jgi:hypothetical protein
VTISCREFCVIVIIITPRDNNMSNMDEEFILQQELIDAPPAPYTKLVAKEWTSLANMHHVGKGDLVFQKPQTNDFLVVETKHLTTRSGATAQKRRTMNRQKVVEQAFRYGAIWRGHLGSFDGTVTMATYTNETKSSGVDDHATGTSSSPSYSSAEQRGKLDVIGQVDYLTPHLWAGDHLESFLTGEELEILNRERQLRAFMAIRIHQEVNDDHDVLSYSPELFQRYYKQCHDHGRRPFCTDSYLRLEKIAQSVLNSSHAFFQPFSPHFIISPNDEKELLRHLRAFLRKLKR